MLTQGKDFYCDGSKGILLCAGLTPEATSTYKVLQLQITRLLPQIPKAPEVTIPIDGTVGPSVALAMQAIITRIAQGHPEVVQELGALVYAPAEQAILGVAQHADVLAAYVDKILTADPNAVRAPTPPAPPAPEGPVNLIKRILTKKRIVAGVATVAGIAGLAVVASASDARALGRVDRSHLLPESDGSDAMDDDDGDEYEDVIDVESVEVRQPERLALPSPEA